MHVLVVGTENVLYCKLWGFGLAYIEREWIAEMRKARHLGLKGNLGFWLPSLLRKINIVWFDLCIWPVCSSPLPTPLQIFCVLLLKQAKVLNTKGQLNCSVNKTLKADNTESRSHLPRQLGYHLRSGDLSTYIFCVLAFRSVWVGSWQPAGAMLQDWVGKAGSVNWHNKHCGVPCQVLRVSCAVVWRMPEGIVLLFYVLQSS